MFNERLLFIAMLMSFSWLAFCIVAITPRLSFLSVLIVAALYAPVSSTGLTIGSISVATLLLAFVGSIAVAGLIAPKALHRRDSLLGGTWHSASWSCRLLMIILMGMTLIATVSTLLRGERAAGTAVFVTVWFLALAAGFRTSSHSGVSPMPARFFFLKAAMLTSSVGLTGGWLMGGGSAVGVSSSVLVLAMFALLITFRSPSKRLATLIVAVTSTTALVLLSWVGQSLWGGVLFGALWMWMVLFMHRTGRLAKIGRLLAIVVFASILVLPVTTLLMYRGQQTGVVGNVLLWGVEASGDSEWNLMNRPARWEALIAEIQRHPFNLSFTNFTSILYSPIPGVTEATAPHNILISVGIFFGIPGMIIASILTIALISSLLRAIADSNPRALPITLGAFGIVSGLLFRNMWSNALFAWPIEITLFSLAVLAAWQAKKVSPKIVKQAVLPKLQSGPSKGQHFPGGTQ